MQEPILNRLHSLGLQLPSPPRPAGYYVPVAQAGSLVFVSAQFPFVNGTMKYTGQVGGELSVEQGRDAAVTTALNVLSQLHTELGTLERLESLVFVEGHIASAPDFHAQPRVLDGASELFRAVLREKAGHGRAVFSPARLPLDAPITLIVTAEVR